MNFDASMIYNAIFLLIQLLVGSEDKYLRLDWIPYEEVTKIEPAQIDDVYYASRKTYYDDRVDETSIMLLCLGNNEECTPTFVSKFARIYSLPTHKYNNDVSQYRRYCQMA